MTPAALLIALTLLSIGAFWIGKSRSLALVGGSRGVRHLHSLPSHYGLMTALWCALPCLIVLALWLALQDRILSSLVTAGLGSAAPTDPAQLGLLMNDVRNALAGSVSLESLEPQAREAAVHYQRLAATSRLALAGVVLVLGALAIVATRSRISPQLRARNSVERIGEILLLVCASLAVFVTLGAAASPTPTSTRVRLKERKREGKSASEPCPCLKPRSGSTDGETKARRPRHWESLQRRSALGGAEASAWTSRSTWL